VPKSNPSIAQAGLATAMTAISTLAQAGVPIRSFGDSWCRAWIAERIGA